MASPATAKCQTWFVAVQKLECETIERLVPNRRHGSSFQTYSQVLYLPAFVLRRDLIKAAPVQGLAALGGWIAVTLDQVGLPASFMIRCRFGSNGCGNQWVI